VVSQSLGPFAVAGALGEKWREGPIHDHDFAGTLPAGFAADSKTDVQKGEVHAIAYSYSQDHVQHIILDKTGRVSHMTEIAVRDKPIMHDFALTPKYVVLT
jgi:carotenoid cleavage dioxygenase-like enzyme